MGDSRVHQASVYKELGWERQLARYCVLSQLLWSKSLRLVLLTWLHAGPPGGTRVGVESGAAREMCKGRSWEREFPLPAVLKSLLLLNRRKSVCLCTVVEEMTRAGKTGKSLQLGRFKSGKAEALSDRSTLHTQLPPLA